MARLAVDFAPHLAQVEGYLCHSGSTVTRRSPSPFRPKPFLTCHTLPYQVPDVTSPAEPVPAVSGTIADVSSSQISDSLRVVIGDAIPPEESESDSDSPPAEVKKPKKGIFGGLFGSNKEKIEVRAWMTRLCALHWLPLLPCLVLSSLELGSTPGGEIAGLYVSHVFLPLSHVVSRVRSFSLVLSNTKRSSLDLEY